MKNLKMKDIIPRLMEEFPGVDRETIEKIIKHGCANITHWLVQNKDIDLHSKREKVRMLIYKPSKPKPKKDVPDSSK
jgi:hypothetical protein